MANSSFFSFLNFRYAPHRIWQVMAALPVIGVVVAVLGPFGSYTGMQLWARIVHFALCFTVIGVGILEGSYLLARRFFAGTWPLWLALLFDLALSCPAAVIVYGSLRIVSPEVLPHIHFIDLIWQNYLVTVMVRLGITGVAIFHARQLEHMTPPAVAADEAWPLADCLPFALRRAPIAALSSEDHYLRVYTTRGEALIHMTMAEAVAILGKGFQVHRSHWVSAAFIRDHRAGQVELTTGLSLPVSRHRRREFEAWLLARPI